VLLCKSCTLPMQSDENIISYRIFLGMIFISERYKLNHLKTKRRHLYLRTHPVPRSKHFSSRL
jgi:hypothetical protein